MRYEDPQWRPHHQAEAILAEGEESAVCETLIAAALYDDDAAWIESWCARLAGSSSPSVRGAAAICLGHVARRFRSIHGDSLELLRELGLDDDDYVRGQAQDALEDVEMFASDGMDRG